MQISIFDFKVKLFQPCVGIFSVRVQCDEFNLTIHNVSLYIWADGTRQVFLPSNFKKESLIESEDIIKFIREELTDNFLNAYLYFKNSIFRESIIYTININLEHMLHGISIDLYEYEIDINEELKEFKAECSITNEEIRVSYSKTEKDEDHKFEILNTIFKFIEDKNPTLREDIKTKNILLKKQKIEKNQNEFKYKDSEGLWRDRDNHELIYDLLPEEMKKRMEEYRHK